jgi:hypothetical protein
VFNQWGNHLNNYGFQGQQRPDLIATPRTTGNPDAWIDPSAFKAPSSDFVLGNAASRYTQLRERAERNVDLSIAKTFPIVERVKVQFRGEALNLFNYAQYYPGAWNSGALCLTCGTFGQLNGTENPPRMLQFSLKVLF